MLLANRHGVTMGSGQQKLTSSLGRTTLRAAGPGAPLVQRQTSSRKPQSGRGEVRRLLSATAFTILLGPSLGACALVGPTYVRETAVVSKTYKESKGWKVAAPGDAFERDAWWSIYEDPRLDFLVRQVEISNQTVKAAAANYEQARAIIRKSQASLFPTLGISAGITRMRAGPQSAGGLSGPPIYTTTTSYNPQVSGSWSPDVWGKIRRQIESDAAVAQASAADLANAKLAAQAMLVTAYFNLSATDSLRALLDRTVSEYRNTLKIMRNQVAVGTISRLDTAAIETQLLNAEAQAINTEVQRSQLEHAIAVLMGHPPADLTITVRSLPQQIPDIPVTVPSLLLERRPDVAAAERQMQEQNALIGVAAAAYYPNINLGGTIGLSAALPLNAADLAWSLGASAAETLFDGGSRSADVAAARAAYRQSVANYRQTVLIAFQQVEDQLSAIRILKRQVEVADGAVNVARRSRENFLNQYRLGVVDLTTVIVAQSTLLESEQAALATRQSLFVASASLIEALGGGWDASQLPTKKELAEGFSALSKL
jgi:NodT family efflux transporter outer membrane factor (OMF) lipoprotein